MRRLLAIWALPLGVFAAVFAPAPARAQLAQNPLPASLPNVPQQSPLTHIAPVAPPNLGAGLPNFGATGPEGVLPSAIIQVQSVSIIGATAFPPEALNAATRGLAQHAVPLSQIEAARRALVDLYRGHGFVLTTVSLDIDAQGNVRFIVTEGRIVAVKLSQDIGPAGTMVLKFLDHLTEERPVSEASLERWLLLAQQIPGVSVHAVLQAEAGDPGALTLIAEVAKQNVSALFTADNRSFEDTGPAEGLFVLDANSQTSLGDQTEVSIFHTSGGTDNFGAIFRISTGGTEAITYSFSHNVDGSSNRQGPNGVLESAKGNFFGTTTAGGKYGAGMVFEVSPTGVMTVLHSFGAPGSGGTATTDGTDPEAPLVLGKDGSLYGTTYTGGAYGYGTVFKVSGVTP